MDIPETTNEIHYLSHVARDAQAGGEKVLKIVQMLNTFELQTRISKCKQNLSQKQIIHFSSKFPFYSNIETSKVGKIGTI